MSARYTKYNILHTSAFTLIELLVVISIIGILAAMVTISFTASQRQARDTQRKSDLSQYRSSIEGYANINNGLYPIHSGSGGTDASGTLCTELNSGTCPEDPKNSTDSTYLYKYQSDANGTTFVLWAKLENVTKIWVVCSTGQSGTITTFNGGACPI
jgi:prepilin-type N-terminal cleavage/methylation domain-containing protein